MEIRINENITLATGQQSSEAIICILNPRIFINEKTFMSEISCWVSLDVKDTGVSPTGLEVKDSNPLRFAFTLNNEISDDDINNGIIYANYVKQKLVAITGCSIDSIEILN